MEIGTAKVFRKDDNLTMDSAFIKLKNSKRGTRKSRRRGNKLVVTSWCKKLGPCESNDDRDSRTKDRFDLRVEQEVESSARIY